MYDIGGNSCEKLRIHLIAKTQRRATTKERRTPGNILEESQHIRGGGIFQAKPIKEKKAQTKKRSIDKGKHKGKEKSTNKGKVIERKSTNQEARTTRMQQDLPEACRRVFEVQVPCSL